MITPEQYFKKEKAFLTSDMPADVAIEYDKILRWSPIVEMMLTNVPPTHDVNNVIIILEQGVSKTSTPVTDSDLIAHMASVLVGREVLVVSTIPDIDKIGNAAGKGGEGARSTYGNITWKSAQNLSSAISTLKQVDLILLLTGKRLPSATIQQIVNAAQSKECANGVIVILQPIEETLAVSKMIEARGIKLAKSTMALAQKNYPKVSIREGEWFGTIVCLGKDKKD